MDSENKTICITTEHYLLRPIQEKDLPFYETLAQGDIPFFLQEVSPQYILAWDELQNPEHLTCSIFLKETNTFCGFCQLQWISSPTPELGIDLLPEFQNQGLAAEVLPIFLVQTKKLFSIDYFYSKIKKTNLASQRLAEKIGGICIGSKNLLPANMPKNMISYAEKEFPDLFYLEYHFYPN